MLTRSKPLRANPATTRAWQQRSRAKGMRQVSKAKVSWTARYHAALKEAKQKQIAERGTTYCEKCDTPGPVEGHHIRGRVGANILIFRLIDRACHILIHDNAKRSRAEGWLS